MQNCLVYLAIAALSFGCRSKSASSNDGPKAPGLSASASSAAPPQSSPTADASTVASADALVLPAPAPAKIVTSKLAVMPEITGEGTLNCPFVLHSLRGAVLVTSCAEISVLKNGELTEAKLPTTGFGVNHFNQQEGNVDAVHRITGRWPDALVVDITRLDPMQSDRGGWFMPQDATYELVGGRWREVLEEKTPQAAAFSQGRTLVFRKSEFSLLAGRKDQPLPVRAPSSRDCGASNVSDFAAMTDGTVVTVGLSCAEPKHVRAEVIEEGKDGVDYDLKSATPPLAKASPRVTGESLEALFAIVPSDRGIVLWQYAKSGFVELSAPSRMPLVAGHVTAKGDLWLAFAGPTRDKGKATPAQVYRRLPSGVWESIQLPSSESLYELTKATDQTHERRFVPDSIASLGDGQVWLAGTIVEGVDKPVGSVVARIGEETETTAPEIGARSGPDTPEPYRSGCESPFVLLYSVGDAVPADFTFPATRDALRGTEFLTSARFVEFHYKDKRTLGSLVQSAEKGNALIERLKAGVRGSKPQLMCFAPKSVDREVSLK